jgi:hypothetical protein
LHSFSCQSYYISSSDDPWNDGRLLEISPLDSQERENILPLILEIVLLLRIRQR